MGQQTSLPSENKVSTDGESICFYNTTINVEHITINLPVGDSELAESETTSLDMDAEGQDLQDDSDESEEDDSDESEG
ncbi:hypothetical protein JTE90_000166 [Oedothorax gibbosus]|uniref:Uncharacterized protein n=1 Tax=Oedothorax gibbosus TaxID=931172 RepID=A0AAV6UW61_9ARAC|nr:hypothetical protein JTE90_000166 [Oedothorax gibbosus]